MRSLKRLALLPVATVIVVWLSVMCLGIPATGLMWLGSKVRMDWVPQIFLFLAAVMAAGLLCLLVWGAWEMTSPWVDEEETVRNEIAPPEPIHTQNPLRRIK